MRGLEGDKQRSKERDVRKGRNRENQATEEVEC